MENAKIQEKFIATLCKSKSKPDQSIEQSAEEKGKYVFALD